MSAGLSPPDNKDRQWPPKDRKQDRQSGNCSRTTPGATSLSISAPKPSSSVSQSGKNLDLSDKLGKDGKLKSDERKCRMEKNLCLYCGAEGHLAKDCRKVSVACGRAITVPNSTSATPTGSKVAPPKESSDSKK